MNLDDASERIDIAGIMGVAYQGSLLCLVSRALERSADPMEEVPLLGMTRFLVPDGAQESSQLIKLGADPLVSFDLIVSDKACSEPKTRAHRHSDFDNDQASMNSVVQGILKD